MEQTTQKHYFIKKNTAVLDASSFEGRCLLSSLTNKEQFLDYFEEIYETLEPGTVETIGEYDNKFKAEFAYQEVKDLVAFWEAEKMYIVIVWSVLEDEDGTIYGKSFFKNAHLEHVLELAEQFDRANQDTQEQVMSFLLQNQISM